MAMAKTSAAPFSKRSPASPSDVYWRDIQHYQPLSRAEETRLTKQARAGDQEAMHRLVNANLRFVVSIAKGYTNFGLSFIELVSEGNWGLMEAVRRFDETRGFKFITYAVWWIRQAILKALAEQSKAARPPMSQINDLQKIEKSTGQLAQQLGRVPTQEEIAEKAQISLERTRNALALDQHDLSLDAPLYQGEEEPMLNVFAADEIAVEEKLDREELDEVLRGCLALLDQREELIIRAYFGLEGYDPMTLEQIGYELNLTRERVRQLRDKALQKIRVHYGDLLLELSKN